MARTPLMHLLLRAARECARVAQAEQGPVARRTILRAGAGVALAALAPPEGIAASARIAVVGAGLAGLTAAYRLQRAGYAVDVFEGSTRLGGRCYTARGVFADGQIAEHGGEFIDTGHKAIRALAAELGLTLDDVLAATPARTQPLYVFDAKPYTLADATRDWQPLYPTLQSQAKAIGDFDYRQATPAARHFDAMTITEWVATYVPGGRAGQLGQLIENAFTEENAADAERQSALNLITILAVDPRDGFNLYSTDSDQRFHVRGGNDQIPGLLGERLGARIRTAMPLVAIARRADGRLRLSFKRDGGVVDFVYERVILALPFSVMRAAVDYRAGGFRSLKNRAIKTQPIGASVKIQLQFTRRSWNELGCSGEIRLPSPTFQTSWEVTRAQPGQAGVLNFWSCGTPALHAGGLDNDALAATVMGDAAPALPGLAGLWNGIMTKDAWAQNPWSLGSYSYFPPGYQTSVAGIEAEPEGHCFFAGEHTSSQNGYLNAGVETGERAARQVIASLRR
ncbi:MAG: FAD-dependent oxidoreductase [Acetobacteraceae bacterium]